MAEFKGRRCDRDGCNTVVENVQNTPTGWIKMTPVVAATVINNDGTKEYCSDYCLAHVAVDRYEAATSKRFMRSKGSGVGNVNLEAAALGGRKGQHTIRHTRENIVDPSCEFCIEDTETVGANGANG